MIDYEKLDFSDLIQQVERREYHCKTPFWVSKLIKKREKKIVVAEDEKGHRKRRSFVNDTDGGRNQKLQNPHVCLGCKLEEGEQFKYMFHPGNIRDLVKPKTKDGEPKCLRWHTMGFCFKDCKFLKGHGRNDAAEEAEITEFVKKAREKRKLFMNRRAAGPAPNPEPPATVPGQ